MNFPYDRDIECADPWFSLILAGHKPVEGRKGSPTWAGLAPGQVLRFRNGAWSFRARIVSLTRYASLRDYLAGETLARALPGVATLEEGEAIYHQWSTPEEIAAHGMLAIEVSVL